MRKTSLLLILGILAVVFTGAYTGYLFWQNSSAGTELKKVEKTLSEYQAKAAIYEEKGVMEAVNAKKTLNQLKAETIQWSKIIKKIRKTIPQKAGINVLSYSGSANNEVSMNVKTNPESEKPYFDVADLIEAFDNSQYFADSFVPSISSGLDDEAREVLTFLFRTRYMEEKPLEISEKDDLGGALEDVLDDALDGGSGHPAVSDEIPATSR